MILKKAKSEKVIFVSLPQLKSKPMLPIFGAKTNTDSNFEFYVLFRMSPFGKRKKKIRLNNLNRVCNF